MYPLSHGPPPPVGYVRALFPPAKQNVMFASAGDLFTSFISWTVPTSVQQSVVRFFFRKTLANFLEDPNLLDADKFDFQNGSISMSELVFKSTAVQSLLPGWTPDLSYMKVASLCIQLPWPNMFSGPVQVCVQSPKVVLMVGQSEDEHAQPASPHLASTRDPSDDTSENTTTTERSSMTSSTFESLVTSFGMAFMQRLHITLQDVCVELHHDYGSIYLCIPEIQFDGKTELASCNGMLIDVARLHNSSVDSASPPLCNDKDIPLSTHDTKTKEEDEQASEATFSEENTSTNHLRSRLLHIPDQITIQVVPVTEEQKVPMLQIHIPNTLIQVKGKDVAFLQLFMMDFFKPDQSSDWNNISLGTNVAFLTESSLTSLKLRIISEDTSMHSDADSSTRVELKVENVHARALYTGQGFEEMCIQLPTLELYEVLDALRYHPIIRINMEPDPMSSLPDSPTWVLGHILVCEGGWDTIFPLGARNDFAICARQNTEGFDIEIAPAQLLVDCTMFARLLPFWQAFSSGASSASIPSANTSLIPWEFCHFLLSLLPIISITCSKAQMAIRVPYVYASEERSSTYLARGGMWFLDCEDIATINSRESQGNSTIETFHVDVGRVSISQLDQGYFARRFLDIQSDDGSQLHASLALSPTSNQSCVATIHMDINELDMGMDEAMVQSLYYFTDDIFLYASNLLQLFFTQDAVSVATCLNNGLPQATEHVSEAKQSLDTLVSGASLCISVKCGMSRECSRQSDVMFWLKKKRRS